VRVPLHTGAFLTALLTLAAPAVAEEPPLVLIAGKVLTMDAEGTVHNPGMLICQGRELTYVGAPVEPPAGARVIELPDGWVSPGLLDIHTHIQAGGFQDINDMVQAVNPELRARAGLIPANPLIRRACNSGVTTVFGIPGSGTNMGGLGVLYKTKAHEHAYSKIVMADQGGLKVSQDSNPQGRNATDFGVTRAGQGWILTDINERALSALRRDHYDPALEDLKRALSGEIPVLIHTAGSEGVMNSARMWGVDYGTRCFVSHGSFDGWRAAKAVAGMGVPVNHGPRTIDYQAAMNGRVNGSSAEYVAAGVPLFSLTTDSSVIPQEELFLQGAMSARYGGDPYTMLEALTTNPAQVFGIEGRVGSLEPGKDADVVVRTGDPLDPRAAVLLVLIDGVIEYDREATDSGSDRTRR